MPMMDMATVVAGFLSGCLLVTLPGITRITVIIHPGMAHITHITISLITPITIDLITQADGHTRVTAHAHTLVVTGETDTTTMTTGMVVLQALTALVATPVAVTMRMAMKTLVSDMMVAVVAQVTAVKHQSDAMSRLHRREVPATGGWWQETGATQNPAKATWSRCVQHQGKQFLPQLPPAGRNAVR